MGYREGRVIRERLKSLDPKCERMTRINSGVAWTGQVTRRTPEYIILKNPRPFHGAPKGTPDICGWTTVTITPDMVGQKVAIFTAEEVKVSGTLTKQQSRFGRLLERMGGIFRVLS